MSVNLKSRKYKSAAKRPPLGPPLDLDAAIVATIERHGSRAGIELLAEVPGTPRQVVDALMELVSRDVLRHEGRRFSLRVPS